MNKRMISQSLPSVLHDCLSGWVAPFAPLRGSTAGEGQRAVGVAGQGRGGTVRVDGEYLR